MYNHFQLAKRYLRYFFTASNGKGHGVHSPFVFDFIKNVLNDQKQYDCYNKIEQQRQLLRSNNHTIEVADFGAGSKVMKTNRRVIRNIANSSLKPKKFAQLLFRMVQYYKPATTVELGTSLGVTSAYLSQGNSAGKLYTCEGADSIAAIAQQTFDSLQLKNIELVKGDFSKTLPLLFSMIKTIDLAFIDGNHREEPTLQYFQELLTRANPATIFIFDDIHWSSGMEAAWSAIRQDPAVTLTIDLFFIGLVFINSDFKVKQHFTVRF